MKGIDISEKIFLIVLVMIMIICSLNVDAKQNNISIEDDFNFFEYGTKKEITEPEMIMEIAEEENFENPEDIVRIVYCYFDEEEVRLSSANTRIDSRYFGNDYYLKNLEDDEERGKLLRSSKFVAPGGSMTVTESIAVTVSATTELDYDFLSAALGFDVEARYSVSETQRVSVPSGKTYTVKAYVNNMVYSFDVWENDVFKDDLVCEDVIVKKPIGVVFTVTKN